MNDLKVPIRDRRQRKRILTLKNFGRFAIAAAIVFAGLTIRSNMNHASADDYGRLFGKQVARENQIAKPKYDVIKEAPVADQTNADPLLIEPAARAQYLAVDPGTPAPAPPIAADVAAPNQIRPTGPGAAIVGDSSGVTIVRGKSQQQPVLSGGIFKQQ